MSRLSSLWALWFGQFRFKEFLAVLTGAATIGQGLGAALGLPPDRAVYIAGALALVGALCYIRNPKDADWAKPGKIDGPDYDAVERDPLDESRDKDAEAN